MSVGKTTRTNVRKQPTTAAMLIASDNESRKELKVFNVGAVDVYFGGSDVTADNGILVPAMADGVIQHLVDTSSSNAWYAIATSSTGDLRVVEVTEA